MACLFFPKKFVLLLAVFQIVFLVLFALYGEYHHSANDFRIQRDNHRDDHAHHHHHHHSNHTSKLHHHDDSDHEETQPEVPLPDYYPMFQDVHVMIFIGFGFLMTFLKKYGFSSVAFNLLIAAFVIQWSIIISGLLHLHHGRFQIDIISLLTADFAAAAVLITFGALLGKTSPLQMIIIAFIEIVIFTINEHVGLTIFKAVDVGGSMFVHVFGAYFGLAVSRVIWQKDVEEYAQNEGSRYHSDLFSMIGTVFLWMYWPSFNSALAPGDDQHRAVINTYLSLAACCVTTFIVSSLVNKEGKLHMEHIQNATLAGGVAVGTAADMMIQPWGAVLIGIISGTLSVMGFTFITPYLSNTLKIHDTCGVNNLHGMPGIVAGVAGIIYALVADTDIYGYGLYTIFTARAPINGTELLAIQKVMPEVAEGFGRSARMQATMQVAALVMSATIATVGGALTGLLLKIPIFDQPRGKAHFDDSLWWEMPEDFVVWRYKKKSEKKSKRGSKRLSNYSQDDEKLRRSLIDSNEGPIDV